MIYLLPELQVKDSVSTFNVRGKDNKRKSRRQTVFCSQALMSGLEFSLKHPVIVTEIARESSSGSLPNLPLLELKPGMEREMPLNHVWQRLVPSRRRARGPGPRVTAETLPQCAQAPRGAIGAPRAPQQICQLYSPTLTRNMPHDSYQAARE